MHVSLLILEYSACKNKRDKFQELFRLQLYTFIRLTVAITEGVERHLRLGSDRLRQ